MLQDSFQSVMVITLQLNVNVACNVALVGNTLMSVMTITNIALEMKFLLWFESESVQYQQPTHGSVAY